MKPRALRATLDTLEVGTLEEAGGIWSFRYAADWLAHPEAFALSPHLPLTGEPLLDGASRRPVQWYFDNLLPEEGQRQLLARDAGVDVADAFALLGYYGAESAGSLTLLPAATSAEVAGGLRPLPDAALEARIRALPAAALSQAASKRMSLAGAQHKLAVVLDGGGLHEPVGATPSTHILKPDHPGDAYPHSVINEYFVMRLADRLGLAVPEVQRRYVPSPVYLIERFDRCVNAAGWRRLHAIDACQLLGLDRSFKYSQGSVQALAELARACRSPAVARTRLYAWMVFNVLVGNGDAHLKNLSFRVSHEGIETAPFYDLLSIGVYDTPAFGGRGWPQDTRLAWPLVGVHHFGDVDRSLMIEAGRLLGLARGTAERLLDNLRGRVVQEAEALYLEVEAGNAALSASSPGLAARLGSEARCLRAVVHSVIRLMARQMA